MTYTFDTTPDQEAVLTWVVQQANLQKDLALTNQQFVQQRFVELLAPFVVDYKKYLKAQVSAKFDVADPATQQQVLTALKIS